MSGVARMLHLRRSAGKRHASGRLERRFKPARTRAVELARTWSAQPPITPMVSPNANHWRIGEDREFFLMWLRLTSRPMVAPTANNRSRSFLLSRPTAEQHIHPCRGASRHAVLRRLSAAKWPVDRLKNGLAGGHGRRKVTVVSCSVVLRIRWSGRAPMPSRLCAILLCGALAGCAAGTAAPLRSDAASMRHLLAAPAKPDCTFHEIGLGDTTSDAAEVARHKLDYERRCYRRAEMMMRARLRRVQAALAAAHRQVAPICSSGLLCPRRICDWSMPPAASTRFDAAR
jgi:hypothetical protein